MTVPAETRRNHRLARMMVVSVVAPQSLSRQILASTAHIQIEAPVRSGQVAVVQRRMGVW